MQIIVLDSARQALYSSILKIFIILLRCFLNAIKLRAILVIALKTTYFISSTIYNQFLM